MIRDHLGREVKAREWRKPWALPLSILTNVVGATYGKRVQARKFGLTEHERSVLRGVVRGNLDAAEEALTWILDLSCWHGYGTYRIRARHNQRQSFAEALCNNNKPGWVAQKVTARGNGRCASEIIAPSRFRGVGASRPNIVITDAEVVATADGNLARQSLIRPDLWELRTAPLGTSVVGGALLNRVRRPIVPVPDLPTLSWWRRLWRRIRGAV
jgi:hypothetical protein